MSPRHRGRPPSATPAGYSTNPNPGSNPVAPCPGHAVFGRDQWSSIARRLRFSPRELQIVHCVFDDLTDAAIAAELDITENTVHTHFERLYRKLTVRSRSALVLRVVSEHLAMLDAAERAKHDGRHA